MRVDPKYICLCYFLWDTTKDVMLCISCGSAQLGLILMCLLFLTVLCQSAVVVFIKYLTQVTNTCID